MKKLLITLIIVLSVPLSWAANLSKEQAAQMALQQFSGRVLSVKQKKNKFHVKILSPDGQVRVIKIKDR